ncbi:MAG: zinc metallopeptidase [Collinsella sp.]
MSPAIHRHYNPQDNNLYLSDANRSGGSVASVAVACHEAGHAAQRQSGYAMMKVHTALVPVVNFTQNTWTIVLLMGLFMNIAGLTTLALIFFSFSVLFQLVTLPVEIDASRRAVAYIEQSGMSSKQVNGAKKVLTAAALTYVAAALTSIIQLLYLMARYNRNSNR